jgi:hypothetical protein
MMLHFHCRSAESPQNCTKAVAADRRQGAPELLEKQQGRFKVGLRSTSVLPDTDLVQSTSAPFSQMMESEVRQDRIPKVIVKVNQPFVANLETGNA